ncbi:hypothetical protein N483_00885 [Pseudoalteromonas luteoviolacea NCIMB 1944]|uniref:Uncharacterized protein n=1 Tax=Pseudoalteromonas luteoviolacea (strain 2ta16) TaxID=1353533 RepID=V4HPI6_PSEL2|nr:hypothetical protein PL2TA16_03928 [Pseudoalteromonas luteoviolacea 2ta16]KZN35541.1 hypothetical protein N483_00885 [Pseudoalteromonas luteoviolacea NCIMB 1944]
MIEMLRNGELHLAPVVLVIQVLICLAINIFVAQKYKYSKVVAVCMAVVPLLNMYATCVYIALAIFHSRKPLSNSEN